MIKNAKYFPAKPFAVFYQISILVNKKNQQQSNALYDYNNDVYLQAYNQILINFENAYEIPENINMGFLKNFDFKEFFPYITFMVSSFAVAYVGLWELHKKNKQKAKPEQKSTHNHEISK